MYVLDQLTDETLVVLIDMQWRFTDALRYGALDRILPNQIMVLEKAKDLGISVAILEFDECGQTLPVLMAKARACHDYHVFTKNRDSGFSSHKFIEWLRKHEKVETLFLMGINAGFCVKGTATDAIRYGYRIATNPDVIAGQSHHKSNDYIDWFSMNGSLLSLTK